MPKISLDMPAELLNDLKLHVGDQHKFVSVADAIRTACRKLLDQLDEIDTRHGRIGVIDLKISRDEAKKAIDTIVRYLEPNEGELRERINRYS